MTVSCIMPTRGREVLALKAVQSFKAQTYSPRELVILDDEDAPSFPLGLKGDGIQYHRASRRLTIAEKRNECCTCAKGDIICHWDDDDWSAPERIADQIRGLDLVAVTGYNTLLFFDERDGTAYRFERERRYGIGTSLMYRKSFWERHRFKNGNEDPNVGEDNQFGFDALISGEMDTTDGRELMVARIHAASTAVKNVRLGGEPSCGSWRALPVDAIPKEFFK